EARATQKAPDSRNARVGLELEHRRLEVVERHELRESGLGVLDHRPELEHLERSSPLASARLSEEDRPARIHQRGESYEKEKRGEQNESEHRESDVEGTLDRHRR